MTPQEFVNWRKSMQLSKREAGRQLGLSPFTIANYEAGIRRDGAPVVIPRPVDLACMALTSQLKGWSEYPR
jgi:predicted transcriptional regulator